MEPDLITGADCRTLCEPPTWNQGPPPWPGAPFVSRAFLACTIPVSVGF